MKQPQTADEDGWSGDRKNLILSSCKLEAPAFADLRMEVCKSRGFLFLTVLNKFKKYGTNCSPLICTAWTKKIFAVRSSGSGKCFQIHGVLIMRKKGDGMSKRETEKV